MVLAVADVDGTALDEDAMGPRHAARAGIAIRAVTALTRTGHSGNGARPQIDAADDMPDQQSVCHLC